MLAWGRRILSLGMTLLLAVLGYTVCALLYVLFEAQDFRGTCPGGPPDVTPYACSVAEFAGRLLFGPFSLPAHLILLGIFLLGAVSSWVTGEVAMALVERSSKKPPG